MSDEFTCPRCGSHYFGRDTTLGPDGRVVVLDTVRCHGEIDSVACKTCSGSGIVSGREEPLTCPVCSGSGQIGKPCGWKGVA